MLKAFTSLITVLVLLIAQQKPSLTPFENAEKKFLEAYVSGDHSEWKNADSILLTLKQTGKFESKLQEVQGDIYRLQIHKETHHYSSNEEKLQEDLGIIQAAFDKNPQLKKENKDYYFQLKHFEYRIHLYQGQENAWSNLQQLAQTFADDKNIQPTSMAALYETISRHYYFAIKDNHMSKTYGLRSLNALKNTPWKYKQVAMNQWTGGNYYNLDKIDSSIYHMNIAYQTLKEIPNEQQNVHNTRSQLAFNLGMIYQGKTGDMHESEHYLKEAIDWEIKANGDESPTLITYYSLLADTFYYIKDIEKAEFYGHKAYSLAHEILQTESVYLKSLPSMTLSRIYVQKGNFDQARKLMDKVLQESLEFYGKDDKFTTQAFIDKASVEEAAGNLSEAEKYYLLAVESAEATQRIYSMQSAYQHLASMYLQAKDYQKALPYALLSWQSFNDHLDEDYKAKAMENIQLAKIYVGLDDLTKAKEHLKQAEKIIAKNSNTQLIEIDVLSIKNAILLKEHESSQDLGALQNAFQNIQALIDLMVKGKAEYDYQNSKLFYSQSIAEHIENALEIAAKMHEISPDQQTINTIFKLMELNKSSVLLDGIMSSALKAQKGVPQSILDNEKKLNQQLAVLNREIARAETDSLVAKNDMEKMLSERIQLNLDIENIQQVLKEKHPMYYEAKNVLLSEEVLHYQKNALKTGQAFLEYYVGNDKIYRLFITQSAIDFSILDAFHPIDQTTDALIHSLIDRQSTENSAKTLGQLILPSFPKEIDDLIIISDKKLTQIPFEILQVDQALLLEKMNVSYAGSVQLYLVQKQLASNKKSSNNWTGFAPEYKVNQLPNNHAEVDNISTLTHGKKIIGAAATKDKFLEEAPKASILHLATHSEFDKINPMLSKMYFYDGEDSGELTASEVYNLDLNANLVVLSACNTGLGKIESGDGVMSISRAFTYAGVSSTIMSLWKVSDKETSTLMLLFYENLENGQSKNEALRNAKLTYLQNTHEPELKHPYYWAGFVISGDVTTVQKNSISWWQYGIGLLILLGLIVGISRRIKASRAKP